MSEAMKGGAGAGHQPMSADMKRPELCSIFLRRGGPVSLPPTMISSKSKPCECFDLLTRIPVFSC